MSERPELSVEARTWLLALARQVIAQTVADRDAPVKQGKPAEVGRLGGCFVSLHTRAGALRGCLGTFSQDQPLWHAVRDMAIAAATRDPRFRPLTSEELDDCFIEISALSPRQPVQPEAVEVGRHGLVVTRDLHSGVLLPQVAVDHNWDRETFLEQTCLKASLPADAWRDGSVTIETFTAEVFSESH